MHVINQEMMSRIKMRIYGHVVCAYPRLACVLHLGKNCEFRCGWGDVIIFRKISHLDYLQNFRKQIVSKIVLN